MEITLQPFASDRIFILLVRVCMCTHACVCVWVRVKGFLISRCHEVKGPTSVCVSPNPWVLIGAVGYKGAYSVEKCSGCLEPSQPIRAIKAKATQQPSQVSPPKLNHAKKDWRRVCTNHVLSIQCSCHSTNQFMVIQQKNEKDIV